MGLVGLPIHQASACDAAAAESLGDELLKNIQHTSRHNKVVAAWVRAVRAARGAAHTRATSEAPDWSAPSVPDFVSEFAGHAGSNQAGEVKVNNPIVSDAARQLLRGATMAFGATRVHLLAENLGDYATPPSCRRGTTTRRARPSTRRRSTAGTTCSSS